MRRFIFGLAAVLAIFAPELAAALPTATYNAATGHITIGNDLGYTSGGFLLKSGAPALGSFGTGTSIISAGNPIPGTLRDTVDLPGNLVWLDFPVGSYDIGNIVVPGTPPSDLRLEYYAGPNVATAPLRQGLVNFPEPATAGSACAALAAAAIRRRNRTRN